MKTFLIALAMACVAVPGAAQPTAPPRDSIVVTPAWLAQHLHDPDLVIVQVGVKATYDAGHIPGARFVNFSTDLAGGDRTGQGLTLEMLPADVLHDRLAALGISSTSRVIVCESDDWWSPSTRVMFTLDYAGLTRTAWLDGGFTAWKAAGQPTTTDVPAVVPGKLSALAVKPIVVDAEFVQKHVHAAGYAIVDARAPEFYDGTQPGGPKQAQKSGHIPGALSAPFDSFTSEDVRLKSAGDIKAIFDKAGVKPGDTIVAYCHIGQQATATLFAARTLGHPVLLYDGSFQDWALRGLPVENPSAKKRP